MFMIHFIAIHAIFLLAGGLITYHFARKYSSAPLNIAAWILMIGGALILLCNIYSSIRYWNSDYLPRVDMSPMHDGKALP